MGWFMHSGGKKDNKIEMERLKDEVRNLSERAQNKKRAYDKETNKHMQGIIAAELGLMLDALDACKDRERIITRNLQQAALVKSKQEETKIATKLGVSEEVIDNAAFEHEAAVANMQDADRIASELAKTSYRPEQTDKPDLAQRMAELQLDTEPEPVDGLPANIKRRLQELDLDG